MSGRDGLVRTILLALTCYGCVAAHDLAGLIRTGLDTLNCPSERGFDFVQEKFCTTLGAWSQECASHIEFARMQVPDRYVLSARSGYGIPMGKMNLDSIVTAPSDSMFKANNYTRIENLFPDSLSSYIGNVYVIKTGPDPGRGYPLIGKLKILDIIVQNAAEHRIDMVFLWAVNFSGLRDLATTNLDTFDLDSGAVAVRQNFGIRIADRALGSGSYRIKRMLTPGGVVVGGRGQVWDLRGRAVLPGQSREPEVQRR